MVLTGRPPDRVLTAFGVRGQPVRRVSGGQGRVWTAGDLVLKPVDDVVEAVWAADVLSSLVADGFRINRPVRSRADEWAVADRMAWDEEPCTVKHEALRPPAERLTDFVLPERRPSQVIHGDLTGNVLFAPGLPPGVIDFTPYWRPAPFCLAIVAVDAVLWHGARTWVPGAVPGTDGGTSLLARAALRRLITSDRLAAGMPESTRGDHLRSTVVDHQRVLSLLEQRG